MLSRSRLVVWRCSRARGIAVIGAMGEGLCPLSWLGGAIAGANLVVLPSASSAAGDAGILAGPARGYGNDPDLLNPSIAWPRTMSARQLQLSAIFADLILLTKDTAPAPSAVGIPDFVDEWGVPDLCLLQISFQGLHTDLICRACDSPARRARAGQRTPPPQASQER